MFVVSQNMNLHFPWKYSSRGRRLYYPQQFAWDTSYGC